MKKIYLILIGILFIMLGTLLSIYSGYDDSPGGVLIGGIIVSTSLITMYLKLKRRLEDGE